MRKLLIFVVLLLTGTAAYLWFQPTDDSDSLQTDQELLPDYVAQNITRRLFDVEGYLVDTVSAERLEHFELLGFTQFEKPVYTLYNNQHQPSWQASSQYAVWFPQDKVILEQQVSIDSLEPNELIERIETERLEMLFPDNKLKNNQPVLIQGKGFYIKGSGIDADLSQKTFQLLQHEHTVYQNED
ncbi:LPS export ABC transporter periplasmic protein LptC [Rheinheimera baltica]|uniref:Lipopolysaccharide export system protein LptC n=1 Tax=Rheinheimera baltica TaxID=67576 RepID=A0ABT9HZV5_9GAMM|nr:LPS export ABC transporter periplasmic protein LptC [Rheinheimera baltica]MDP5136648.1 LPS export ABC transporter periplasmic protein LptC [Rheinheimera baltica]MDP5142482.1 LPS export ABC transporter periplasmic protein LptC [Rheinheimera baltica]MDP5150355.1 LPS export ABC transporter periplasmic protein LptC [Rheinheimera baltica]MDP5188668.1 LPS export ABC transporter periplasmic protein LptC [Rheinheimera baltica]